MGEPHGPQRRRQLTAVVLLAGCGLVLGGHAVHGARVTWDLVGGRWDDAATATSRRLTCLEQQVEGAVPSGSRVSVDPALSPELWQRSLEFAWQRGHPVRYGEVADVTLEAAPGNPGDPCRGAVIVARPGPTAPIAPANRRGGE